MKNNTTGARIAESVSDQLVSNLVKASLVAADVWWGQPSAVGLVEGGMAATLALAGLLMLAVRISKRKRNGGRRPRPPAQFEPLRRSTKCPFARAARLLGACIDRKGDLERRVHRILPELVRMTKDGRNKRLDGFVLRIPAESMASDLRTLSQTLNGVLRILAQHDPSGVNCFADNVGAEPWQFSFNGTRFFITTFAPFYGKGHSRFSESSDSGFIYFQPDYSFDHHGIFAGNPDRERVKQCVRRTFVEGGVPYNVALVTQSIEALKYVKPLRIGDPSVEWWHE